MVPNFPFCISEDDIWKGAVDLLTSLRPAWSQSTVQLKVFTEGITNKLIGIYVVDEPDDIILFRLYGKNTELIIDRKAEVNTMKLFSSIGCAAPLYATFSNGICYGFVPGETLNPLSVRDEAVQRLIAEAFVRIHCLCVDGNENNQPVLFPLLKRYLDLVPSSFSETCQQEKFEKCIPSRKVLCNELQVLETHLSSLGSPVVFCHNDALLKNIVYDKQKDRVTFIDYEYAGYNYQAYDIGNHFCEFAGVQDMDFSLYPDRNFQLSWLMTYVGLWNNQSGTKTSVSNVELERLYVQVNKFALASHFMWGIWGLVQAAYSTIDFDYLSFASARLNEYFARKEEFMKLKLPQI